MPLNIHFADIVHHRYILEQQQHPVHYLFFFLIYSTLLR